MSSQALADYIVDWMVNGQGNKSNARQETGLMSAFIESYWKVSSKRFLDAVPSMIITHFLHEIAAETNKAAHLACTQLEALYSRFMVSTTEKLKR